LILKIHLTPAMKKIVVLFSLIIPVIVSAQKLDLGMHFYRMNGKLQYIEVYEQRSMKKETLAKKLAAMLKADTNINNLNIADSVITGQLIQHDDLIFKADFTIYVRNGRYKVVAKNLHEIDSSTKKDELGDSNDNSKGAVDDTDPLLSMARGNMAMTFIKHFTVTDSDSW